MYFKEILYNKILVQDLSIGGICGLLIDLFRILVNVGCLVGVQSWGQGYIDYSIFYIDYVLIYCFVIRNSINII